LSVVPASVAAAIPVTGPNKAPTRPDALM